MHDIFQTENLDTIPDKNMYMKSDNRTKYLESGLFQKFRDEEGDLRTLQRQLSRIITDAYHFSLAWKIR